MSDFIQRLTDFMETFGINDNQITMAAGLSNGLIGKAKNAGKALSASNIEKILNAYPDLSAQWLLTGKGEMLKSNYTSRHDFDTPIRLDKRNDTKHKEISQTTTEGNILTRPRIPFDAAAGSLSIALGSLADYDCEQLPLIPTFPRYDFTIIARGDSMIPDFLSGDELACAFVHESGFIQWGRPHVLDTAQGVVVKRIFNESDSILCRSINTMYPDFEIPKNEIFHIALVVGLLRHF